MNIKHIESYNIEVYSEALKDTPVCKRSEVRELEANYEEAIEAMKVLLIECMDSYENMYITRGNVEKIYSDDIGIIEKATGLPWKEVKNDI